MAMKLQTFLQRKDHLLERDLQMKCLFLRQNKNLKSKNIFSQNGLKSGNSITRLDKQKFGFPNQIKRKVFIFSVEAEKSLVD